MNNIVTVNEEWLKEYNKLTKSEQKLLFDTIFVCHTTDIVPKLVPHLLKLYNMFKEQNEVKDEKK